MAKVKLLLDEDVQLDLASALRKRRCKMQKLPTEQQKQVLRFIEFLAFELGDRQVNQESESQIAKKPQVSPRDLLKKWEGGVDDR